MASSHLPLPHSGGPIFPPTTQPIIVYESMGPDYDEVFLKGLVKQMTFEEKVSLLCGASFWGTASIEGLDIPRMELTDGPSGARGEDST